MIGHASTSVDRAVSFCPLADKRSPAKMVEFCEDNAYLTTSHPPRIGEVVKVVAGNTLKFTGNVTKVDNLDEELYGFEVESFAFEDSAKGNSVWDFAPEGVNQDSFRYHLRLGKVQEFVLKNYSEQMSLSKVARIAALEKSYFSSFFHKKVGVTYNNWLQSLRIAKAIEMMRARNDSVTEICFAVGFGDLRTFERAFKKWTGVTPREYKRTLPLT